MRGTPLERLMARREVSPSGCWLWTGSLNTGGYGQLMVRAGVNRTVHRLAYQLLVGPIPQGLQLDHLCRTRSCFNPAHLEPVQARTNVLRGVGPAAANSRKTHCKHGHEFTPENTYLVRTGRECRTCKKALSDAYYRTLKARAA